MTAKLLKIFSYRIKKIFLIVNFKHSKKKIELPVIVELNIPKFESTIATFQKQIIKVDSKINYAA